MNAVRRAWMLWMGTGLIAFCVPWACAQSVGVTARFDRAQVSAGQTTVLRVLAQVLPERRAEARQIFSWYVDLTVDEPTVAGIEVAELQKVASDRDPQLSGNGVGLTGGVAGVYDTFLNRPGAGVAEEVELLSVPVKGLRAGTATFHVSPGSGVPGLSADFLVAPLSGSAPLRGGDYSQATATLEITSGTEPETPVLSVQVTAGDLPGEHRVVLTFQVSPGRTYVVEGTDRLGGPWQSLANAPHDNGSVTELTASRARFYRVRVEP